MGGIWGVNVTPEHGAPMDCPILGRAEKPWGNGDTIMTGKAQRRASARASAPKADAPKADAPDYATLHYAISRPRYLESQARWVRNASPSPLIVSADDGMLTITRPAQAEERGEHPSAPAVPNSAKCALKSPEHMVGDDGATTYTLALSDVGVDPEHAPALVAFVVAILRAASQKATDKARADADRATKGERDKARAIGQISAALRRAYSALAKGTDNPNAIGASALCIPSALAPTDPAPIVSMTDRAIGLGWMPDPAIVALAAKARKAMDGLPMEPAIGATIGAMDRVRAEQARAEQARADQARDALADAPA